MEVHIIGSGDVSGSGGRYQTRFALRDDERNVLIDCGTTSLTSMKAAGFNPLDVHAVVIRHLHGDHFGGIPFMVLDAQFRRRTEPIAIYGPSRNQRAAYACHGGPLPWLEFRPPALRPPHHRA